MKRFSIYLGFWILGMMGVLLGCSGPAGGGTNPPPPPPPATPPPPPSALGSFSGTWTSSFTVPNSRQTLGNFTLQLSETGGTLKGSFVNRAPLCPEHTAQGALSPTGVMLVGSRTPNSAALSFGYTDSKGNAVSFDLSLNKQEDTTSTTVSGIAIATCNRTDYEVQLKKSTPKK